MHGADFKEIKKDKIIEIARDKKQKKCPLIVIVGFVDKEGKPTVSYSFDVHGAVETYTYKDGGVIPSITSVYGVAAEWFEEEISEFMGVEFEGLQKKGRLFLPEEFDGSGQIFVSSMSELKKNKQ